MTDSDKPHLPQLDHDGDGKAGGAKKAPLKTAPAPDDLVWVVTRAASLHRVAASEASAATRAPGGRMATDRDLAIAGIEI